MNGHCLTRNTHPTLSGSLTLVRMPPRVLVVLKALLMLYSVRIFLIFLLKHRTYVGRMAVCSASFLSSSFLSFPLHRVGVGVIYKIGGDFYISKNRDEVFRLVRIKDHKTACRLAAFDKSAVAEHNRQDGHYIS